jgi:hypothetical protein
MPSKGLYAKEGRNCGVYSTKPMYRWMPLKLKVFMACYGSKQE